MRVMGAARLASRALVASDVVGLSIEEIEMSDLAGEATAVAPICTPSLLLTVGGLLTWQTSESVCTGRWRTGSALCVRALRSAEQWMSRPRWVQLSSEQP